MMEVEGKMSPVLIVLIASIVLQFAAVPIFLKGGEKERTSKSTVEKTICSLLFITTGACAVSLRGEWTKYAIFMMCGFAASLIGDIMLDLPDSPKNFLKGEVAFFGAHCLFITAYTIKAGFSWIDFVIIAAIVVVMLILQVKVIKLDCGKILVPTLLYMLAVLTMFVKGVSMIYLKAVDLKYALIVALGATFFIISDGVLGFMEFGNKNTVNMRRVNIITYYLGQVFLALSILYI